jgi:hypothetical protein
MALGKEILTETGITCYYYVLARIEKDKINKTGFVVLYGYPNQEIRNNGAKFSDRRFINIYPQDYNTVFGIDYLNKEGINDYQQVYTFIKENFEEFKDAIDLIDDAPQMKLNMNEPPQNIEDANYYETVETEIYE